MPSTVPTLDPEWIEKVEPILPKLPSGSVQDIRGLMEKLDAVKLASLNETMPELKEGLDISNVMVPMRDGVEREMRIFKPQGGSAACPVYMSYHGGGWCTGSNDSEELINRKIAKSLNVVVFSLDYRLAPEDPFPTPFDDAEDGLKWVFSNAAHFGGDVGKGLVVGGTSSGGHLASLAAFRAHKAGIRVDGCFMRVPMVLDRSAAKESWQGTLDVLPKDVYTPMISWEAAESVYKILSAPGECLSDPWYFPVFAESFEVFPRTYLQVAGLDPQVGEGLLYEQVLRENGVETKMDYYKTMPHPFHGFQQLAIARQSITDSMHGIKWLFRMDTE